MPAIIEAWFIRRRRSRSPGSSRAIVLIAASLAT
jgi:hypothetical protein